MIKEIDWKDITEDNKIIASDEMNNSQAIDTSHESLEKEQPEECVDTNTKLSPVFFTTATYQNHPFAEIFPESTDIEIEALLESVKKHGQYEPIILFENKIADGRTRKKVQDTLQQPTLAQEWTGEPEDLLNYLYAKSQHRHLTSQQRAVIALQFVDAERKLANQRQGMRTDLQHIVDALRDKEKTKTKNGGRALDCVAKKLKTNRTYIGQAEYVQQNAGELLNYVKRNEVSLTHAKLLAQKLTTPEERQTALQKYNDGAGKMQSIIDDILFEKGPAHETSQGSSPLKSNSDIKRKIVFAMKISKAALEDIKDVLHKHGYSGEPYQILVATSAKEEDEMITPLLQGENIATTTYEVIPDSDIQPIDQ